MYILAPPSPPPPRQVKGMCNDKLKHWQRTSNAKHSANTEMPHTQTHKHKIVRISHAITYVRYLYTYTVCTVLYASTHMYGCIHVCMAVYTYVWLYTRMYGCIHICMALYTYVWLYTRMYGSIHICMALYTYVWLYTRMY